MRPFEGRSKDEVMEAGQWKGAAVWRYMPREKDFDDVQMLRMDSDAE